MIDTIKALPSPSLSPAEAFHSQVTVTSKNVCQHSREYFYITLITKQQNISSFLFASVYSAPYFNNKIFKKNKILQIIPFLFFTLFSMYCTHFIILSQLQTVLQGACCPTKEFGNRRCNRVCPAETKTCFDSQARKSNMKLKTESQDDVGKGKYLLPTPKSMRQDVSEQWRQGFLEERSRQPVSDFGKWCFLLEEAIVCLWRVVPPFPISTLVFANTI